MTMTLQNPQVDPEERAVEEVHCIVCNVPIPSIPSWYAQVNVRFTCDNCRQKSSTKDAALPLADLDAPRAADADGEAEPALDELEEDIDIEDDAEVEADADTDV